MKRAIEEETNGSENRSDSDENQNAPLEHLPKNLQKIVKDLASQDAINKIDQSKPCTNELYFSADDLDEPLQFQWMHLNLPEYQRQYFGSDPFPRPRVFEFDPSTKFKPSLIDFWEPVSPPGEESDVLRRPEMISTSNQNQSQRIELPKDYFPHLTDSQRDNMTSHNDMPQIDRNLHSLSPKKPSIEDNLVGNSFKSIQGKSPNSAAKPPIEQVEQLTRNLILAIETGFDEFLLQAEQEESRVALDTSLGKILKHVFSSQNMTHAWTAENISKLVNVILCNSFIGALKPLKFRRYVMEMNLSCYGERGAYFESCFADKYFEMYDARHCLNY